MEGEELSRVYELEKCGRTKHQLLLAIFANKDQSSVKFRIAEFKNCFLSFIDGRVLNDSSSSDNSQQFPTRSLSIARLVR